MKSLMIGLLAMSTMPALAGLNAAAEDVKMAGKNFRQIPAMCEMAESILYY